MAAGQKIPINGFLLHKETMLRAAGEIEANP